MIRPGRPRCTSTGLTDAGSARNAIRRIWAPQVIASSTNPRASDVFSNISAVGTPALALPTPHPTRGAVVKRRHQRSWKPGGTSKAPDSGGPGRFRGGLSLERHIRFLAPNITLAVRSDRHDFAHYGLNGGDPGAHLKLRVTRADGTEEAHFAHFMTTVQPGDRLEVRLPSDGGFGDPLERDPHAVLRDVLELKISIEHAAQAYGVVITQSPPRVSQTETLRLRAERRG